MKSHRQAFSLPTSQRLVCAMGGVAGAAVACGVVIVLFAQASTMPWLPATDEALAVAKACDSASSRKARDQCMQRAVAQWRDTGLADRRIAAAR